MSLSQLKLQTGWMANQSFSFSAASLWIVCPELTIGLISISWIYSCQYVDSLQRNLSLKSFSLSSLKPLNWI